MISYLNEKFEIEKKINNLNEFKIDIDDSPAESLTFEKNLGKAKQSVKKYDTIDLAIRESASSLENLLKTQIDSDDKTTIKGYLTYLEDIREKYDSQKNTVLKQNKRIEIISNNIDNISSQHRKTIGDKQKEAETFSNTTMHLVDELTEIIKKQKELSIYYPNIVQERIDAKVNHVFKYDFVSKLNIEEISNEYLETLLKQVLKKNKTINWDSITESELNDIVKYRDDNIKVTDHLRQQLLMLIDQDLQPKNSIVENGEDKYKDLSSGFNSKIYFDLISHETNRGGIYLIDQPEDNVSQTAIREYLLEYFKSMSEVRQVLLVTHNPQFVVNLDVDNLIYISSKDNTWNIQSGALEYECDNYNVLQIVANNIDGGLSSIKQRWKRYEKTT